VRATDEALRSSAGERVALLTPIVKAWCTELAEGIASTGIQVHGGVGYIEETGAAQHLRDARILSIYEGTNGVQALDLVGRKLALAGGEIPWRLFAELRAELPGLANAPALDAALVSLEGCTRHLQGCGAEDRDAGAAPYLRLFGTVLGAFLLARGARAAGPREPWHGLTRFYLRHLLPPALALAPVVRAGAGDLDPAILAA
jgi:hypothetical protein